MGRKKNTEDRKCEYALKGRKKRLKKNGNGEYALRRRKKKTDEKEKW